MKILAIGDQHFKLDNIIQVDIFISKLKEHLEKEKYDLIVSGGDLLDTHERLHTQCLNKAIEYIKLLSSNALTYVLVGNHDMINPSQFLTDNHWLNVIKEWDKSIYNVKIVDTPIVHTTENSKMVFCPYVPDGMFVKALDTLNEEWRDSDLIFGHQTMDGVKMGSILAEGIEKWDESNPNLVCFHVHDMQHVQSNLFYTGSAMQHSFGEGSRKSLMRIFISDDASVSDEDKLVFFNKRVYVNKIDIGVPRRKIITCSTKDLENMNSINDIIPAIYRNDMYILKVVVNGNYNDFKNIKKKEIVKKLMARYKLIFKHEVVPSIEKDDKMSYNKNFAFKDMFDEILKSQIDEEMYKMYLSL